MTRNHIDPEQNRWDKKFPSFPGVSKCVDLLHSANVNGTWVDIICQELQNHAAANAREMIGATGAELELEANSRATLVLLIALEWLRLPETLPLFSELLSSSNERVRIYAIRGLENLDSKESRRLLLEHRSNRSQSQGWVPPTGESNAPTI